MPGEVHGDQCVRFGQAITEAAPEPSGLRESVQQHQWRPGAAYLDMEWHAG